MLSQEAIPGVGIGVVRVPLDGELARFLASGCEHDLPMAAFATGCLDLLHARRHLTLDLVGEFSAAETRQPTGQLPSPNCAVVRVRLGRQQVREPRELMMPVFLRGRDPVQERAHLGRGVMSRQNPARAKLNRFCGEGVRFRELSTSKVDRGQVE